ncbi:MAG: hypothetical protein L3J28_11280 [Candidatus Polarisedimenticolaceae bacterium]|nr:hypothetical protein [Candidatus Polarisedimenticolaceae bacterium]
MKRDHISAVCRQNSRLALFYSTSMLLVFLLFGATSLFAEQKPAIEMGISEYAQTDEKHPVTVGKKSRKSTTDHTKLKELEGPFYSGPEVTQVCLECHNTAGHQFMQNKHWTWDYKNPKTGQRLGKSQ